MLVVGATARVVHLNGAAERIIAAGDGLTISKNTLGADSSGEDQVLRQLVASAAQAPRNIAASPGGVMQVTRKSGRAPYQLLVAPPAPGERGYGFGLSMSAAVFVRDPEARTANAVVRKSSPPLILQKPRSIVAKASKLPRHPCGHWPRT